MTAAAQKPADNRGQQQRADFKEAYYVIGDKISGLEMLAATITDKAAEAELLEAIGQLNQAQKTLSRWAGQHLPKWD